ncbi:MerR family transcriptional regulator [Photobacterium proteolyticum]|uniref:MerR family transcriptional regulator n=1 Tax=Photobacterium proteolyticum TaxID=1903952 RepID=A0A1Q9GL07_9GAMM|nr:MerR family DNA-binding transcriptional regulator [Photobacterium proteolyticum]OLQ75216.1 MerR family transcriptional regulator [Photobacterium proteolyticum]
MKKDKRDNAETYTISQLAQEFSVTLRSIRFYEDQGLLKPARKGKQRIFSRQDRARLKLILRGKRLGFSLTDIHELFHLYDSEKRNKKQLQSMLNTIQHRQNLLQQQQADIHSVMMELNSAERSCYQQLAKFD